jgi:MOSC domain-containing protein YiiM
MNFCFQRGDAMKLFADLRRPGVYFEVLREGRIQLGDSLQRVKSAGGDLSVLQLFDHLTLLKQVSAGRIARADAKPTFEKVATNNLVPEFLRSRFQKMIQ